MAQALVPPNNIKKFLILFGGTRDPPMDPSKLNFFERLMLEHKLFLFFICFDINKCLKDKYFEIFLG